MTRKNKFLGCVLGLLIAAQFWFGIFSTVWIALRPLQPIPEIYLDVFKVCAYKRWRLGELIFVNMAISFGVSLSSNLQLNFSSGTLMCLTPQSSYHGITDVLAFLIILVIAMRRRSRYPGIPTLLDTILRDATVYFILIFFVQFLSELFMFVTPEGIQHLPGVAITIFGPVMVSRLMLSLKKAAVDPKAQWSLETMSNLSRRKSTRDGTVRFAPSAPDRPHEISVTWDPPDEEDIEFDVMLRFP
ncbi:hypothetical protein BDM02DRAFT_3188645 [Thelephora ganbajun]|uniref:Uncharacterized protein n=1 Tax=Thelephora ganbajun TaxID=370292 RepID=A0ACB6ZAQ9_THEGA|nr:hypothetical protein BDM02DRAFT_3188645 [Thelephora ganbajun]